MTRIEIADKHPDFFMKRDNDGFLRLPAYYTQVQGYMAVLDVEWCDFAVFSNDAIIIDQIVADYDYWMNLMERLEQFYLHHVIPELLPH